MQLYLAFFRSTWPISISVGIGIALLISLRGGSIWESMLLTIPTAGLGMDFLYKELSQKEAYFFFYNRGISKIRLWLITLLISVGSCFTLYLIGRLCVHVWKWIVS